MHDSLAPDVVTTLKFSDRPFTFEVVAYRKLTRSEAEQALKTWMAKTHRKNLPKTGTIRYTTLIGLDP